MNFALESRFGILSALYFRVMQPKRIMGGSTVFDVCCTRLDGTALLAPGFSAGIGEPRGEQHYSGSAEDGTSEHGT